MISGDSKVDLDKKIRNFERTHGGNNRWETHSADNELKAEVKEEQ